MQVIYNDEICNGTYTDHYKTLLLHTIGHIALLVVLVFFLTDV